MAVTCTSMPVLKARGSAIARADSATLRDFMAHLDHRGLQPASSARKLSALRQLHRFLYLEQMRGDDPSAALSSPKTRRPLPKTLSTDDVTAMLTEASRQIDAAQTPGARARSVRLLCMLRTALCHRLARSELISLPASRRPGRAAFHDHPRQGQQGAPCAAQRSLPPRCCSLARGSGYRAGPGQQGAPAPWLFPATSDTGHVTRQAFARELKALAGAAGIRARTISPMCYGTPSPSHLLQNGADLRVVQELLGHADISTTQIYTHILDERLKAMVRDLHPSVTAER